MANLRFPEDLDGNTDPWILFSTQRPKYDRQNRPVSRVTETGTNNSVGLYFPVGHSISDSLNYGTFEEGLAGMAIDRFSRRGRNVQDITGDDVREVAGSIARSATPGNIGDVLTRRAGKATNPREFMMFNAPNIRDFSFSFRFVPHSFKEANDVPEIIKFFRVAAYPRESTTQYIFPDTFKVNYKQGGTGIIKLPELACTSVNVTYNPNSISYFVDNGIPVEITLELSFTELRPISRTQVERGL